VIVANGHHWESRLPEPPIAAASTASWMHSHDYVSQRAADAVGQARGRGRHWQQPRRNRQCSWSWRARGTLSVRRGAWVLPKFILGRSIDQRASFLNGCRTARRRAWRSFWYRLLVGEPGLRVCRRRIIGSATRIQPLSATCCRSCRDARNAAARDRGFEGRKGALQRRDSRATPTRSSTARATA